MSRPSILLTIAIPTYKRSGYLARLLDSLLPQLKGKSEVELLISDNASPDDTLAVIESYKDRGVPFRYIRNETNIGPDRNFVQCFLQAVGQYVWIVGDDDVLLSNSVDALLSLLVKDEYDLIYLRNKSVAANGEEEPSLSRSPRIEVIDDARRFAQRTHVFLTFITGNVINKQRVESYEHPSFYDLADSNLVHLGWTFSALRHFRRGVYIHTPMFAAGAEDRGGYALYEVFGTNLQEIAKTWLVEPELVAVVLNGTLQTFFPSFVLQSRRCDGPFAGAVPEELLRSLYPGNYRFYLFLYPLMKLPIRLAGLWLLVCRIVNRINKELGNPMLR